MKKIVFDDSMGAAGDMIAGVLLDLFEKPEEVVDTLNKIIEKAGLEDTVVELAKEFKDNVDGIEFNVSIDGKEEEVDHWDEEDHEHPDHWDHDHPHYHDHWDHDHPHYHEHCDHPHHHFDHDHFEHRHPHGPWDHFEHRHPHGPWDHDHCCDHHHDHFHDDHDHSEPRRCRRPRMMGMPKPFGPCINIEGPIEINLTVELGKPPKKHRPHHHHHHHHHSKGRSPKTVARSERKARNRAAKKRTLSMGTGKDHLH